MNTIAKRYSSAIRICYTSFVVAKSNNCECDLSISESHDLRILYTFEICISAVIYSTGPLGASWHGMAVRGNYVHNALRGKALGGIS